MITRTQEQAILKIAQDWREALKRIRRAYAALNTGSKP